MAIANHDREDFSVANYKNEAIYITGGDIANDRTTNSVVVFDLVTCTFHAGVPMQKSRESHSSTSAGYMIAVFGGCDDDGRKLSSIEILDIKAGNRSPSWQFMNVKAFTRREYPLTCPIGESKILVCGGQNVFNCREDFFVLDTQCKTAKKIDNMNIMPQIKFKSESVAYSVQDGIVIALASVSGKGMCLVRADFTSEPYRFEVVSERIDSPI